MAEGTETRQWICHEKPSVTLLRVGSAQLQGQKPSYGDQEEVLSQEVRC